MDLKDLWTGLLSWRRLGVLVRHLPPESATKTALRNAVPDDVLTEIVEDTDREYGPWSQTDMLLAELVDLARWLQWSKTKDAALDQPQQVPKPFPRPGVDRAAAPAHNAKVFDLLEYVRAHHGASPPNFTPAP